MILHFFRLGKSEQTSARFSILALVIQHTCRRTVPARSVISVQRRQAPENPEPAHSRQFDIGSRAGRSPQLRNSVGCDFGKNCSQ